MTTASLIFLVGLFIGFTRSGQAETNTETTTTTDVVPKAQYDAAVAKSEKRLAMASRFERQRNRVRRQLERAQRRWVPTVDYAIRLASAVTGVSHSKMRSVAYCESRFAPYAQNGRYKGLFQLGWSPFGFSPFDPVANALSAALTVQHDGSWRQWECG